MVSSFIIINQFVINHTILVSSSSAVLSFNQSSPSYDIVCPGDTLVFTCITSEGGVVWRINGSSRSLSNNSKTELINGFLLSITDVTNNTVTSTASVNVSAPLHLNGTVIDCSGDGLHYSTLTVHIGGKIHHEPYVS